MNDLLSMSFRKGFSQNNKISNQLINAKERDYFMLIEKIVTKLLMD